MAIPTKTELVKVLKSLDRRPPLDWTDPDMFYHDGESLMLDIRLQCYSSVREDFWMLHTGDSQYDCDHRGSWGVSSLPFIGDPNEPTFDYDSIATDLLRQIEDCDYE